MSAKKESERSLAGPLGLGVVVVVDEEVGRRATLRGYRNSRPGERRRVQVEIQEEQTQSARPRDPRGWPARNPAVGITLWDIPSRRRTAASLVSRKRRVGSRRPAGDPPRESPRRCRRDKAAGMGQADAAKLTRLASPDPELGECSGNLLLENASHRQAERDLAEVVVGHGHSPMSVRREGRKAHLSSEAEERPQKPISRRRDVSA